MLTVLTVSVALAATADIVVYDLEVDGFTDRQRELVEASLLQEINKREGLRAIHIEEARQRAGFREETGCEPRDCLAQLVDSLGSELVITGRVTRLGSTTAIALRAIDLRERTVRSSSTRQLERSNGDGVLAALGPMVKELFPDHGIKTGYMTGVTPEVRERWDPKPLHRGFFYGGVALTAATAAVGTIFGIRAVQKRDEFNDYLNSTSPEQPADGARVVELEDAFEDSRDLANGFFIATAASAVLTTTIYFFTDFGEGPILSLTPTPEGFAATAIMRF